MADEDRYYDEDGPAFAEHQRQRAEAESPHEYVGMDTDIGVGVEWEPCHLCGFGKEDEIHVAPASLWEPPAIPVEEIPF